MVTPNWRLGWSLFGTTKVWNLLLFTPPSHSLLTCVAILQVLSTNNRQLFSSVLKPIWFTRLTCRSSDFSSHHILASSETWQFELNQSPVFYWLVAFKHHSYFPTMIWDDVLTTVLDFHMFQMASYKTTKQIQADFQTFLVQRDGLSVANCEVCHLYKGHADNGTLLQSYGFCVPENPYDRKNRRSLEVQIPNFLFN